jgi:hypothetical protein
MIPMLYLAGPMSGLPDYNYPAFMAGARALRSAGFMVVNPAENGLPQSAPWAAHMRRDLHAMLDCQGLALLPGYEKSRGASLEVYVANELQMPMKPLSEWLGLRGSQQAEAKGDAPC